VFRGRPAPRLTARAALVGWNFVVGGAQGLCLRIHILDQFSDPWVHAFRLSWEGCRRQPFTARASTLRLARPFGSVLSLDGCEQTSDFRTSVSAFEGKHPSLL